MVAAVHISDLLDNVDIANAELPDVCINNVVLDSRKVKQDDVFVAIRGENTDGSKFIDSAIGKGASVILIDSGLATKAIASVPVIEVNQLKQQLPEIADNCYDDPSAAITLVAVTGTNGKTTCAHLIAQALQILSTPSAVIGTAGQGLIGDLQTSSLTTPDVFELRRLLAEFKNQNVEAVAFEASSHGLEQGRLDGLKIDLAVFTNLSHDHLDYHADFTEYAKAKLKLFQFESLNNAVMNADQPLVDDFVKQTRAKRTWFYGKSDKADVRLLKSQTLGYGLKLKIQTQSGVYEFTSKLIGQINIENLLAVYTTLLAYGFSEEKITALMPELESVPGRMEVFGGADKPMVIVDYAHTPDALEKALLSLKDHSHNKLYCVFGCGGDRDKDKRPKMGRACEKHADVAVITDDNPRYEQSESIIADILTGMTSKPKVISDRPQAVQWVIHQARPGDLVLVAGKGHESTQQIGDEYIDMSDRILVTQALESWM